MSRARATVRAMSVLPRPGTPSISTCPRHRSAVRIASSTASWPTTALPISARSLSRACPRRATAAASSRSGTGDWSMTVPLLFRLGPQRQERPGRQRAVGGGLLPRVGLDDGLLGADAVPVVVQLGVLGRHALVSGEAGL